MILDVLYGPCLDEDGVDGGGDDGLHPGDDVGGNGSVDQVVVSQVALVQSHFLRSHSISVGKKRGLSPPSRMEIWLE